jgi:hypothetical protein
VRLAEPALRRLRSRDDRQPRVCGRESLENCPRFVGRAIVDDDDLDRGIVLREVRSDRRFDAGGLVARRDDDGDARPGLARGRRRDGGQAPDRQEVDREADERDGGKGRRRDEGAVDEGYDSGTFCRASAR